MVIRLGRFKYPWDYLAVELAVMLQSTDEDIPPYEYISEAREITNRVVRGNVQDGKKIDDVIDKVMSSSLDYPYAPPPRFSPSEAALFLQKRIEYIKKYEV